ncbi:cytochrome P460 family protein [Photobacterium arenosum]|uniref:cytochrome P460 family protein n=1 Tax=Photobacterium arenosum TaxID=2774143 RepID=UPI00288AF671|nr:cytochrome P460 family protein [Photobacterium arenosum]
MRITSCLLTTCSLLITFSVTASYEHFRINNDHELQLLSADEYRHWVYVGTPLTPNDMNNGKAAFPEFHNVYIDPDSFAQYEKTGEFPDGTILVKELVSVGSKSAVSGQGYFQGDFIGLEATIKSKKYFPNEPGNWAYFSFTDIESGKLSPTAKAFSTESCNACHAAAAQDDFVFTQYYPVLRVHKGKKK